jgi:hypothetical protein
MNNEQKSETGESSAKREKNENQRQDIRSQEPSAIQARSGHGICHL